MNVYDLVLFDMDGTLLDSGKAHDAMFERFWASSDMNTGVGGIRHGAGPTIWDVFQDSGLHREDIGKLYEELAWFYRTDACDDIIAGLKFVPEALPLLRQLRKGGIRTALVTNTHWTLAERLAAANGADQWFDAVSGSTAEEEDKRGRMGELIKELGAAPAKTLYVGDNESDARTGRTVGVDCCVVLSPISWVHSYDGLLRDARPTYTVFELEKVGCIAL